MHVSWDAIRQVRVGAEQVEHLRKATQLEGTMKIFAILGSAEMQKARRFIAREARTGPERSRSGRPRVLREYRTIWSTTSL
jgi:hypothetical protein